MYIRLQVGDFYSKIHSYSAIMPYVATWMDLNIITQGEVNQTNIIDNAYISNLKKKKEIQMNLYTKQKHEKVALTYIYYHV